jgi:flagellar biosynthesis protein FlhB
MEEKTEKPTKRKLKQAKERGEVAKSTELASTLLLLGALLLFWGFSTILERRFKALFISTYDFLNRSDPVESLYQAFSFLLYPTGFILVVLFLIALLAHFFQTGWIWSWPKSHKREPFRWFFLLLKLIAIASLGYFELKREKLAPHLFFVPLSEKVAYVFKKIFFLLLKIDLALLFLGICDFFYQKWRYHQQMRMTHQELKEEKREAEGDPYFKAKRIFVNVNEPAPEPEKNELL